MDNLGNMIKSALSDEYEPDAFLLRETVYKCRMADRRESKMCLHVILVYALSAISVLLLCVHYAVNFIGAMAPIQLMVYMYCLSWICTLLPVYILAYEKFTKGWV